MELWGQSSPPVAPSLLPACEDQLFTEPLPGRKCRISELRGALEALQAAPCSERSGSQALLCLPSVTCEMGLGHPLTGLARMQGGEACTVHNKNTPCPPAAKLPEHHHPLLLSTWPPPQTSSGRQRPPASAHITTRLIAWHCPLLLPDPGKGPGLGQDTGFWAMRVGPVLLFTLGPEGQGP